MPNSNDVTDSLVMTSFVVMAVITKIGARFDLSLSLIRVLGILWDRRLRITELSDHLGLEKQTMSGLITRAEKRGLVMRSQNEEDGRATDVLLTEKGTEIVRTLRIQGQQALDPIIKNLNTAEQQLLQKLLLRMLSQ
ncbi:TPA: MarR family transcriptional regulator [Klebsiella pneumoniae]|uniref:MarR family transcriptional regulator n=1 Tax=Klebsiella quasipneumoniae TaxID=1463165 RepID=UPI001118EA7E|nr:MarR family transcriptional regulator [Klebsiella quasipneumoniae]HBW7922103.1 MarR family transcriptional regulator [Klebsiella pneumoniae]